MAIPTDKIPEYETKWENLILSTEPANRFKAEALVAQIYAKLGHKEKPQMIWVDSPWHPLVRTAKIYEYVQPTPKTRPDVKRKKISDGTFHSHARKMIDTTWRRLGMDRTLRAAPPEWADVHFGLSNKVHGFSRIVWRSQHAGFYYGNHYESFALFDWLRHGLGMMHETEPAALAIELAQCCAWWRPHADLCFLSERPTKVSFNELNGPAIIWGDKTFYFIDGVNVPDYVVEDPTQITLNKILGEYNAEVRRIMMNRYKSGIGDLLKDAKAVCRDHDERYGTLWRLSFNRYRYNDEVQYWLEVVNRTPEPDGTFKRYFLRLPPFVEDKNYAYGTRPINAAKEAYDWTWWGLPVSSNEMLES